MSEKYPLPIAVSVAGETVNFHLRVTAAPKAYDGFGTISIYEYDSGNKATSFRLVLIREEHLAWQVGRYQSGMFTPTMPEEWQYAEVVEKMRRRCFSSEPS